MIDESRIRRMAQEYQMNPSTARKLLEHARDVSALRYGRIYRGMLGGGDTGKKYPGAVHRCL